MAISLGILTQHFQTNPHGQQKIPMRHLVDRLRGPGVKALRAAAAVLEVTGGPCRLAALGAGLHGFTML